jgi:hypothetical protein
MTDTTAHKERDDALCSRREVRLDRRFSARRYAASRGEQTILVEKRSDTQTGDAAT